MNKEEILRTAITTRDAEILEYQINIDNYRFAIQKIDATQWDSTLAEPMQQFKSQLGDLLRNNLIEQAKAILIRDVMAEQLEAICDTSK